MQEDKEGFFDTVDTLISTLEVSPAMLKSVRIKTDKTTGRRANGLLAGKPTWADYLVNKGVCFPRAHEATGKLVTYGVKKGKSLKI